MKKEISLNFDLETKRFEEKLIENFVNNMPKSICKQISGLLAIDYANRLKTLPILQEYIEQCVSRLKNFLGHKVITDESFSTSMNLFTIAISPEIDSNVDKIGLNEEKSKDAAIDAVIAVNFADISGAELANLKELLKSMLAGKDAKEIFEFITSQPGMFKSLVTNALKDKTRQEEVIFSLQTNLIKVTKKHKEVQKSSRAIKTFMSKVTLTVAVAGVASMGLFISGIALPVLLVPAVIGATKIAGFISEKASDLIIQNTSGIKDNLNVIKQICGNDKNLSQARELKQSRGLAKSVDIELNNSLPMHKNNIQKGKGKEGRSL